MKLTTACGILLAAVVIVFRAQADEWDKKTVLTVDQPIQVTNTVLEPGTYVFKLANSSSDRHIVQIYTADQRHIVNTILAIPNYRLQPTGKSQFLFWETPPGSAKALRAWFYPGDNFGQEFTYPKQLMQLAVLRTPEPVPAPAPPPAPVQTESAPVPPPPPPAPAVTEAPAPPQQPVEIAQNNPPPQPEAEPQPSPAEPALPKTASPFPLIGLGGLLSICAWAAVRMFRVNA